VFNLGSPTIEAEKGICTIHSIIPGNLLNNNIYAISMTVMKNNSFPVYRFSNCITFEVADDRKDIEYYGPWPGIIRPQIMTYLYFQQPAITLQ
jgi:hypothetical protein